jgi:chaperonin cofactor prefoldin
MGLFWDLIQQNQISEQGRRVENAAARTQSLEMRVQKLEESQRQTREQLRNLLVLLEEHFGKDINRDGRIGG